LVGVFLFILFFFSDITPQSMGYGQNLSGTNDMGAELDLSPRRSRSFDEFCAALAVTLIGISIDNHCQQATEYR
jgi:hypothetical protein